MKAEVWGSMEQTDRIYYPGFDWMRIFGSILVAASHIVILPLVQSIFPGFKNYIYFFDLILIFYMMSGVLLFHSMNRRKDPRKYVRGYVLKYALLYYAVSIAGKIWDFASYAAAGIAVSAKSFLVEVVLLPFVGNKQYQLWFIPPLLAGVLVTGYFFGRHREKRGAFLVLILFAAADLAVPLYNHAFVLSGSSSDSWILNDAVAALAVILNDHLLRGIPAVYFSCLAAKLVADNKENNNKDNNNDNKPKRCPLAAFREVHPQQFIAIVILAVVLALAELVLTVRFSVGGNVYSHRVTIASIAVTVLLFLGIRRFPGKWLYAWRFPVAVFAGAMYFLHVFENRLLLWLGMRRGMAEFCVILAMNIGITAIAAAAARCGKGRVRGSGTPRG